MPYRGCLRCLRISALRSGRMPSNAGLYDLNLSTMDTAAVLLEVQALTGKECLYAVTRCVLKCVFIDAFSWVSIVVRTLRPSCLAVFG